MFYEVRIYNAERKLKKGTFQSGVESPILEKD